MPVLRVLNPRGDDSFEYEPGLDDERLERARAVFEARVGRGYLAFVPGKDGRDAVQLRKFDPRAREIILQPALSGG